MNKSKYDETGIFKKHHDIQGNYSPEMTAAKNTRLNADIKHKKRLEFFRKFVDENYDKLHAPASYPLNPVNMMKWRDAQTTDDGRQFARLFITHLRHVSWSEWKNALSKLCIELDEHITSTNPTRVVMIIDGSLIKSNIMVAMLMFRMLSHHITHIAGPLGQDNEYLSGPEFGIGGTIFIHVDDCSYSGNQIASALEDPAEVFQDTVERDFQYIIACPFISEVAVELLSKRGNFVKFPKSTVVLKPFSVQATKTAENEPNKYPKFSAERFRVEGHSDRLLGGASPYQYKPGLCAVYFDHKLPDVVSVFQSLIALGTTDNRNYIGSLISGCEKFQYFYQLGKNAPPVIPYETDFDDDGTCPRAFYKTIKYQFNGRDIDAGSVAYMLKDFE